MRKFVLALLLALAATVVASGLAAGEGLFDFGDMPPLPPPLVDDSPNPLPLTHPASGASSPLVQSQPSAGMRPPPEQFVPDASAASLLPSAPPLLGPPPIDSIRPVDLPDAVGAPMPTPVAAPAAPVPPAPEVPRPGRIAGGRVNVRAGPNTQYESIAVLTTGMPVTVLARHGEWLKIIYPEDQLASIHRNFVNAEITGEIPEAGIPGVVNQDNVDVHAFYWDRSTTVGKLNRGDPVVIRQERGQWYRIAAPASARAYVFAEYVRVEGGDQVAIDSFPPPANPSIDLSQGQPDATGRLKLSENDRKAAALKESYFRRLMEQQRRDEEQAREYVNLLEAGINELEAKLEAINSEIHSRMFYSHTMTDLGSAAWAPPDPLYGGYTGWVENIGRVGGAPASFRLTKNGEIRFHLRSDRFNLNDFAGRRVWLNGNVEVALGATANVVNVDQIRILTDLEIAEGMRQYAESSGQAQPLGIPAQSSHFRTQYDTPMSVQPPPVIPSDPSTLPDIVGMGYSYSSETFPVIGSYGEVDTDFYENPIISEIGP
ncbi:MAG: SH3 domain-containing protein [Planctomycetes bacterium]|nr:SH3 domain-containing protein [Planctomycetota bacterium]